MVLSFADPRIHTASLTLSNELAVSPDERCPRVRFVGCSFLSGVSFLSSRMALSSLRLSIDTCSLVSSPPLEVARRTEEFARKFCLRT